MLAPVCNFGTNTPRGIKHVTKLTAHVVVNVIRAMTLEPVHSEVGHIRARQVSLVDFEAHCFWEIYPMTPGVWNPIDPIKDNFTSSIAQTTCVNWYSRNHKGSPEEERQERNTDHFSHLATVKIPKSPIIHYTPHEMYC